MQDHNPELFLARVRLILAKILQLELDRHQSVIAYTSMMVSWTQREDLIQFRFNSRAMYIYFSSELSHVIDEMYTYTLIQTENPALPRSGFAFARVNHMNVYNFRDQIVVGSSHIPLPKLISLKVAMINPKNDDNACFMWTTIAALHNHEISSRSESISKLNPYGSRCDWSDISYPTDPRDIRI